jgi:secretion/DNA translocation related CpaE-like protein
VEQPSSAVIAVVGGSGGAGASTFAAVLAAAAERAVLVDLDPVGGGLDVLLGIEQVPGARWSGLQVDGGRLDPQLLDEGLPWWQSVPVLAADVPPPAAAVVPLLDAAASLGTVVIDLPRVDTPARAEALRCCSFVTIVAVADVRELAAARAVLGTLPALATGVVLRAGAVAPRDGAQLLGAPLVAVLPRRGVRVQLGRGTPPRRLTRVAAGVLDGLGT